MPWGSILTSLVQAYLLKQRAVWFTPVGQGVGGESERKVILQDSGAMTARSKGTLGRGSKVSQGIYGHGSHGRARVATLALGVK